ncbi:aldo/keto reductase [Vibrio splendidus]
MYDKLPSEIVDNYIARAERYNERSYENIGDSGLKTSKFALGMWQGFGDIDSYYHSERIIHELFDIGINHFDLGNNYGRPPGTAEEFMGKLLSKGFSKYRNEIILTTKAGYDMWPGPLGRGSSKKYLISSLNDSLKRLNTDYVDVFYSHCYDNTTPLWETAEALAHILDSGKALYIGISSYSLESALELRSILSRYNKRILVNQCNFSILCKWPKKEFENSNMAIGAFSPLAQGLLTSKFIDNNVFRNSMSNEYKTKKVSRTLLLLNELAKEYGRNIEQLAFDYIFSHSFVSYAAIGLSSHSNLQFYKEYIHNPLSSDQIKKVEEVVGDTVVDIWQSEK